MEVLFLGISVFITILVIDLLYSFKKNNFIKEEAKRCSNDYCKSDDSWSSKGRLYTNGFAVIKTKNGKELIKQSKLCDMGILE